MWVANDGDGTVSRIDPETNAVAATIEVARRLSLAGAPEGIAVGAGAVWLAVEGKKPG